MDTQSQNQEHNKRTGGSKDPDARRVSDGMSNPFHQFRKLLRPELEQCEDPQQSLRRRTSWTKSE